MCDYSLEGYKSRAAVDGEDLVVRQFPSMTRGFVQPGTATDWPTVSRSGVCVVCCEDGVEMTLHLSAYYQTRAIGMKGELGNSKEEKLYGEIPVVFHTLEKTYINTHSHRDGFILPNGRYLSIQRLAPGTRATVTKALPKELIEAAKAPQAFEPEIRVEEPTAPVPVEA